MNCPARPTTEKKIGPFRFRLGQPHEWKVTIVWHLWWEITYTCSYCFASESDIERNDLALMRRLRLKKCPSHYGSHVYDEFDLLGYR
jgi:hypothetical protein